MGLNAFFAFTVVLTYKYSWQQALAVVFCSGVLFFILSVFRIREYVHQRHSVPLTYSIATGIGLGFITYALAKITAGKLSEAKPAVLVLAALFAVKFAVTG
jgi:AGZA family xanthine/uracil permease-like MFS transporter